MAKILLVEDEVNIASFIERGLQEFGHTVSVAYNGADGWQLAQDEPFDLLVLDIIMPKMNGLDLCRQYRQLYGYDSPVIMLTALGTTDDIVKGLYAGADDYLADATSIPGNYVDNLIAGHTGNNYTNQSSITIKWEDGADDAKKLERVLTQKWIACYPDPMNGWADFRRTGYPRIFPATESMNADCNTGRGQRRLRFTRSEYNNNKANVEAAVSMLSNGKDSNGTDLWWAMKENGTY
jgi:CheY-like chemotaxis protein